MNTITPELIKELTKDILPDAKLIRQHLHQNPELSFKELKTSAYIQEQLSKMNIAFQAGFAETGILAWIEGANPNTCTVALRADMDALPLQEKTGLPYASQNSGVMHACGHDAHTASLLGSASILNKIKDQFKGRILFIFQPAEEKAPGGAKQMLDDGIFKKFKPDYIIAQHVGPAVDAGMIAYKPGNLMASTDDIYITIKGEGGHAAMPDELVDSVLISSHIIIALQQLVSRNAPTHNNSVLSFGRVEANGSNNIIPPEVKLYGTLRTQDENWRAEAHERIAKMAKGIAESMGAQCEVNIIKGYPSLFNNEELTHMIEQYGKQLLGDKNVIETNALMTAEDFAYFAHKTPSCMYFLGSKKPGSPTPIPLHSPYFQIDENTLETGISILTWLSVAILNYSKNK